MHLPTVDWQALRSAVTYGPSDSMARVRTDHNAIGWFPVFINQASGGFFVERYGHWVGIDELPGFEGFERVPTKKIFDTATGKLIEAA
jgi:hypothetical protein